jgi:tetratricopeptide (TPR) repeat protein
MAAHGNEQAARRAYKLLQSAEQSEAAAATDHELHTELGFLEQLMGQTQSAQHEYEAALKADAFDAVAEGDLALIEARGNHLPEAVKLWQSAFDHDPTQLAAGENLAQVECGLGQRDAALATLSRVLLFSPDHQRARAMDTAIQSGAMACNAR